MLFSLIPFKGSLREMHLRQNPESQFLFEVIVTLQNGKEMVPKYDKVDED